MTQGASIMSGNSSRTDTCEIDNIPGNSRTMVSDAIFNGIVPPPRLHYLPHPVLSLLKIRPISKVCGVIHKIESFNYDFHIVFVVSGTHNIILVISNSVVQSWIGAHFRV
jgi:hypothetical protein